MANFDDFIRKTKELGEKASRVTNEVVDITKLKLSISDLRSQIKSAYADLGTAYYNSVKNQEEFDCTSLVNNIDELNLKLNENEKNLRDLQGIKVCPDCNEKVETEAEYCSKCGAKL